MNLSKMTSQQILDWYESLDEDEAFNITEYELTVVYEALEDSHTDQFYGYDLFSSKYRNLELRANY